MSPSRIFKRVARRVTVMWREQPTQYDIEALEANIERVGLVIRIRWSLVVGLAVFSVLATLVYAGWGHAGDLHRAMAVPAAALLFVAIYNTWYQLTYRQWGNVAILNQLQLLLDTLVVAVLVYYSGGVYSWFHSMFLLIVFEAALILPKRWHVWGIGAAAVILYSFVVLAELFGLLPHINVPLAANVLQSEPSYVIVRLLWIVTVISGAAAVAGLFVSQQVEREGALREVSVIDSLTGLYNRPQFLRVLRSETARAERFGWQVGLVLLDLDRFDDINRAKGFDAGNAVLLQTAEAIKDVLVEGTDEGFDLATAFRYGGEEFGIVLPDDGTTSAEDLSARLLRLAERVRTAVGGIRMEDQVVSASLGTAVFPADAGSPEELIEVANCGVATAFGCGGNCAESGAAQ